MCDGENDDELRQEEGKIEHWRNHPTTATDVSC
jgi:hypothetical protein